MFCLPEILGLVGLISVVFGFGGFDFVFDLGLIALSLVYSCCVLFVVVWVLRLGVMLRDFGVSAWGLLSLLCV